MTSFTLIKQSSHYTLLNINRRISTSINHWLWFRILFFLLQLFNLWLWIPRNSNGTKIKQTTTQLYYIYANSLLAINTVIRHCSDISKVSMDLLLLDTAAIFPPTQINIHPTFMAPLPPHCFQFRLSSINPSILPHLNQSSATKTPSKTQNKF